MFNVCVYARYQVDPKITHLNVVKRISKNMNGTANLGVWYTMYTNTNLVGFSDYDWTGDLDDRKSTFDGCFYLWNNLVFWYSRKQNYISISTDEFEYVVARSCCGQLLWAINVNDNGIQSDIFTKALDSERFSNLKKSLGLCVI